MYCQSELARKSDVMLTDFSYAVPALLESALRFCGQYQPAVLPHGATCRLGLIVFHDLASVAPPNLLVCNPHVLTAPKNTMHRLVVLPGCPPSCPIKLPIPPSEARHIEELRRLFLDTSRSYGYELEPCHLCLSIWNLLTGTGEPLDLHKTSCLSINCLVAPSDCALIPHPQVARIERICSIDEAWRVCAIAVRCCTWR
jgi:hypothetical protein